MHMGGNMLIKMQDCLICQPHKIPILAHKDTLLRKYLYRKISQIYWGIRNIYPTKWLIYLTNH